MLPIDAILLVSDNNRFSNAMTVKVPASVVAAASDVVPSAVVTLLIC